MALWTGIPGIGCSYRSTDTQTPPPEVSEVLGKTLKCRAMSDDFGRKISSRFTIPEQVLNSNITTQSSTAVDQAPNLLDLPVEVLMEIFTQLHCAPSQIKLALTCKQLACLASQTDLGLSVSSPKYAGFLPPAVFDVPGLMSSLRSWMPTHLKFCGHCLTYRPEDPDYWHTVEGFQRYDFWIQKVGWTFKDASWWKQVHDICPACHFACTLSDYIPCDGR